MKKIKVFLPVAAFACAIMAAFAFTSPDAVVNRISVSASGSCIEYMNSVSDCTFTGANICNVTPPSGLGSQFYQYSGNEPACTETLKRNQ